MPSDESNDATDQFDPITANTDNLVEDAYARGYEQGKNDEGPRKFDEGYREAIGDAVWRLRGMAEAGEEGFERCIAALETMKPG